MKSCCNSKRLMQTIALIFIVVEPKHLFLGCDFLILKHCLINKHIVNNDHIESLKNNPTKRNQISDAQPERGKSWFSQASQLNAPQKDFAQCADCFSSRGHTRPAASSVPPHSRPLTPA